MPRKARKLDVYCPNPSCRCYKKKGLMNIIRHGKKQNGTQNYKCTECGRQFVRNIFTPFYRKHIKREEAKLICKVLAEKNGIRATARITEHHKNTIASFVETIGLHCKEINEILTKDLKLSDIEIDEFWTFIKKSKKKWNPFTLRTMNMEIAGAMSH
jgi:transposase-like protein